MSALSNLAEDLVLTYLFTTESATRPSSWFVALHTADPGETGASAEVTTALDNDYERKAITFGSVVPNSGQAVSNTPVSWTVASSSSGYTVTHISIWTASSGGTCLVKGPLVVPAILAGGQTLTFAAGNIIVSLD